MSVSLLPFQETAVTDLINAMSEPNKNIVLKSCTGSGKTIILTSYMSRYKELDRNACFVWLSPGKGGLEEQSKTKMDKYISAPQTKDLGSVLSGGFDRGDSVFINWERVTRADNNAIKDGEHLNLLELISIAQEDGIKFYLIVDESHSNDTPKTKDLIRVFNPEKIIRSSATPSYSEEDFLIDIPEDEVIEQGLVKKRIFINPEFPSQIEIASEVEFLLGKAEEYRQSIKEEFSKQNILVNPLVIVQIPDNDDYLRDEVVEYLEDMGMTHDNKLFATWLSGEHVNTADIDEPDNQTQYILIKQAVAMGWDCPRAYILVKLRDNMSEVFQIQTIGRIRRMPEAHHYGNDTLDNCYIFTMDTKFIEEAKIASGNKASEEMTLRLKREYKTVSLLSEKRSSEDGHLDPALAVASIIDYAVLHLGVVKNDKSNKEKFEKAGFDFSESVTDQTQTGQVEHLSEDEIKHLNSVSFRVKRESSSLHDDFNRALYHLASGVNIQYQNLSIILRRLFRGRTAFDGKLLYLEQMEYYSFFLNNYELLQDLIKKSLSCVQFCLDFDSDDVHERQFYLPETTAFAFDASAKNQTVMNKNVYEGYRSSAAGRSQGEKAFEQYSESSNTVSWVYKNGDHGVEYFSILFRDNAANTRLFFPDYIVGTATGEIWIIEVKGGQASDGTDKNIDPYAAMKLEALNRYVSQHSLKGGFVRLDDKTRDLYICIDSYADDLSDSNWTLISEVI